MVRELAPPGEYGDGPAYLRVRRSVGDGWRAGSGLPVTHVDPEHVFIPADNSHSAFAYRAWLRRAGVSDGALLVVALLEG